MTPLLARVRALEITAQRNVSSLYVGNYVTAIRGGGMEFHEARHYLPGDAERHIDWNMTARHDEPYVRTYLEEREREVFIAVDVSNSMRAGWQARSKLETAMEVAATLGLSAIEAGDKLGYLTFREQVSRFERPRGGRSQLYRFLQLLTSEATERAHRDQLSDPRSAVHAIQRLRGRRFVVFIVSDFIDEDVPDDLRYLGRQHDVTLVHIYDAFEHAGPGPLRFLAAPLEGPGGVRRVAPHQGDPLELTQRDLSAAAARFGGSFLSLSCTEPVGKTLAGFFHRKRQWNR